MKNKNMLWRWVLLAGLLAWSVLLAWPLKEKLPLGIDLKGGFRFVLGVDYDSLVNPDGRPVTEEDRQRAQSQALEVLRNRIDGAGTREATIYKEESTGRIIFEIPGVGDDQRKELEDLIKRPAYLEFRLVHEKNSELVAELLAAETPLPGYNLVTVEGRRYYQKDPSFTGARDAAHKAQIAGTGRVSPLFELMLETEKAENFRELYSPVYVQINPELDGTAIQFARPQYDQYGRPEIALQLNKDGTERFYRTTRDYAVGGLKNPGPVGRRLAIIMDDTLYSAPELKTVISGGSAVITGNFPFEEAAKVSAALNSGALPTPIVVDTVQQVQPTLGKAAVTQGVTAAIVGLIAVILFMLVYYRIAGVVANLGLILDALLLPLGMFLAAGFLGIFGDGGGAGAQNINQLPTLTLPGIAGLVLTIGMAVDANVLIFERIREEQKSGKRFLSAVQAGFDKAFSTIFDANITTLLVAVILFMQGSGPIRGFAVMLTAGIIVSMYSALVFTRMGFDLLGRSSIQRVKMLSFIPENINIDFLGKSRVAIILSLLVLLGTAVNIGFQGKKVLGIDFTGGSSLQYSYDPAKGERPSDSDIRAMLAPLGIKEAVIQYQDAVDAVEETGSLLQIRLDAQFATAAKEALDTAYAESHGFNLEGEETIGAQMSKELGSRGIKAIVFALIGIVIYITLRFEFAFAIGTIVALAHDVLLTVGLYCLFGRQLSLPIVAALLTIVGYSANDTIVVFDRIREDLKLLKGKPYREIANVSINQTLSRTILTSLTTLFTVVALLVFGGGAIFDFALALFIGIIVGTYSTIYIATPVMLLWHKQDKTAKA